MTDNRTNARVIVDALCTLADTTLRVLDHVPDRTLADALAFDLGRVFDDVRRATMPMREAERARQEIARERDLARMRAGHLPLAVLRLLDPDFGQ